MKFTEKIKQHWSVNYPPRDWADKNWLSNARQYRSSNLEWWLSGIVLGLLANIVIYRWLGVL